MGERRDHRAGDQRGDDEDAADIDRAAAGLGSEPRPVPRRRPVAERPLESAVAVAEEIVAGIALALVGTVAGARLGGVDGAARDVELGLARAAGELLDGLAVMVAGGEVHLGEIAALAEQGIDQADALDQLGPVDRRDLPHAGDDVAHGDVHRGLALVLGLRHLGDRAALLLDALLEPLQLARHPRVEIAEAVGELHDDGGRKRPVGRGEQRGDGRRLAGADAEHAVGDLVRLETERVPVDDAPGGAAEVLDEHDAERDGNRPQLADGERLDALIGVDEAAEEVGVETAVGVGDIGPRDAEDAREAGKGSAGELGQLAIISGRQVAADLENLLLDDVIIVEDPFRRRGDRVAGFDRCRDRTVGAEEEGLVFSEPRGKGRPAGRARLDLLGLRQRAGMLFQALGTEELLADELLIVPDRVPRAGKEGNPKMQLSASSERNGQSQAWTENVPAPRTNPSTIPAANRSRGHRRQESAVASALRPLPTLL